MNTVLLDVLPFALLGGMLFALLLTLVIAVVERPLLARFASLAPHQRAPLLVAVLLAPAVGGIVHAALTTASAVMAREDGLLAAVCADHGGSVWHACVWHPPEAASAPLAWVLLTALCTALLVVGVHAGISLRRARRAVVALLRLSQPGAGARVVISDQPLALTAGIDGHVVLSSALLEHLDARQLRIVLAHELAHVAHRDVLWRWLASGLSRLHLPAIRARLRAALDVAVEQRCDRVAATVDGDPLAVAETIVAVERLFAGRRAHPSAVLAAHFVHGMVDARVSALLAPPNAHVRGLGSSLLAALATLAVAANGSVHHLTEFLLTGLA
jgi:Zn-dependent protease with chaperone function